MSEKIIAYLYRGEWHTATEVQKKRETDKGAFEGALPYTRSALVRRQENGRDVPAWVDLNKQDER